MKANELRIGNLFMFGELRHECKPCDILNLYQSEIAGREIGEYRPIPLTEGWLLKFGFEVWHNTTFYSMIAKKDGFDLKTDPNGNLFFGEGFFNVQPKSVHQLQNLYFALTGSELTLNEIIS